MKSHVNICGYDALIGMTALTDYCAAAGVTLDKFFSDMEQGAGQLVTLRRLFYFGVKVYAEYKELPFSKTERQFMIELDEVGFGIEEVEQVVAALMAGMERIEKPKAGAKKK